MNGCKSKPRKSRIQQINEALLCGVRTVYRLRKVQCGIADDKCRCAYVISLVKSAPLSLEEQVLSVYSHLQAVLLSDEMLVTENKCFAVISNSYEVRYCVEAWQKHADKIAYMQ